MQYAEKIEALFDEILVEIHIGILVEVFAEILAEVSVEILAEVVVEILQIADVAEAYTQYGPIKNGRIKNQHSDFEKNKEPALRILDLKNRLTF